MNHNLTKEDLRAWREAHRFSQEEMAALLKTSREWLGKLERGDREISAELYLRFEALKREPKFSSSATPSEEASIVAESPQAPYGTAETLRAEIRRRFESTIKMAGDDTVKLGWLLEQVLEHATAPARWGILQKVIEEELAKERAAQETEDALKDHSANRKRAS